MRIGRFGRGHMGVGRLEIGHMGRIGAPGNAVPNRTSGQRAGWDNKRYMMLLCGTSIE